jgi:hypothetical protein
VHRLRRRRQWIALIAELLDAAVRAGEIPGRDDRPAAGSFAAVGSFAAAGSFAGAVNGLLQDWCLMP